MFDFYKQCTTKYSDMFGDRIVRNATHQEFSGLIYKEQ